VLGYSAGGVADVGFGWQGMETAMNFVTTHVLPRSVEYATRDVIWEPTVELQNLLQGHYYGHPVYKYALHYL
jgi:dsRNA-specific ribonuclease